MLVQEEGIIVLVSVLVFHSMLVKCERDGMTIFRFIPLIPPDILFYSSTAKSSIIFQLGLDPHKNMHILLDIGQVLDGDDQMEVD